jgi:signal transduction histidine kinase
MIQEISEHKLAEETLRTSGEQLREFAARVEAVREEERTRVAREIHDELGQALTVLKLDLSWLQGKIPRTQAQARNKMKSMLLHVDETIERVRRIASELRPSILDDLGLLPAIEWQLEEFQKRTGIRCKLDANVEKVGFSAEASAVLFRVVQEALTNIVRHAAASSARVDLRSDGRNLRMSITDDGKGITEQQINDLRSLGIVGMKERISRVGGEFRIRSQRGKGTRIEISLPNNHD